MEPQYVTNLRERARSVEIAQQRVTSIVRQWTVNARVDVRPLRFSSDRGFSIAHRWIAAPDPAKTVTQAYIAAEQLCRLLSEHGGGVDHLYLEAFERHATAVRLLTFSSITVSQASKQRGTREVCALVQRALSETAIEIDSGIAAWSGARPPSARLSDNGDFDRITGHAVGIASRLAKGGAMK